MFSLKTRMIRTRPGPSNVCSPWTSWWRYTWAPAHVTTATIRSPWPAPKSSNLGWKSWSPGIMADGDGADGDDFGARNKIEGVELLTGGSGWQTRRVEILFLWSLWWQKKCIAVCVSNWNLEETLELQDYDYKMVGSWVFLQCLPALSSNSVGDQVAMHPNFPISVSAHPPFIVV